MQYNKFIFSHLFQFKKFQSSFKNVNMILAFCILLTSCGKRASPSNPDPSFGSIIIGNLDWKEITSLSSSSAIFDNSRFVADISIPAIRSRCTGFLVSEDILMTNEHCVSSTSEARGLTAIFNHVAGVSSGNWDRYDCSEYIGSNAALDFALVRCKGSPGSQYGFARLNAQNQSSQTSIYVIQQNCDYYTDRSCDWTKKYSTGKIVRVESEYVHNADTLGGSSGSPMFSASSNQVIGIHHAGRGNDGNGRGIENFSVPMSKIVPYIRSNFQGVMPSLIDEPPLSDEEPNNSFEAAYDLGNSESQNEFSISDKEDVDYFKVELDKDAAVTVSLSFVHADGDLDLKIFNESMEQVGVSQSTKNSESLVRNLSKGSFYIVVYGYNGAKNPYALKVELSDPQVHVKNNSFETAIQLGGSVLTAEGEIAIESEKDYFSFITSRRAEIKVSLTLLNGTGDLDLYFYNESKELIGSSEGITNLEKVESTLEAGKYYVVIAGFHEAVGKYSLKLQ